jgi:hypothetical protein
MVYILSKDFISSYADWRLYSVKSLQRKQASKVTLSWNQIANLVLNTLSPSERQSSVVYLDRRVLPPNSTFEIDRKPVLIPSQAVVAFVDLNPTANWAHECRYLFVDPETGDLKSLKARLPPFLRGAPETLNVIWKGQDVPSWTVATS